MAFQSLRETPAQLGLFQACHPLAVLFQVTNYFIGNPGRASFYPVLPCSQKVFSLAFLKMSENTSNNKKDSRLPCTQTLRCWHICLSVLACAHRVRVAHFSEPPRVSCRQDAPLHVNMLLLFSRSAVSDSLQPHGL